MNSAEFIELLKNNDVPINLVHFENSAADGYYVLKNHHRWEVFFRERGKDYNWVRFPV